MFQYTLDETDYANFNLFHLKRLPSTTTKLKRNKRSMTALYAAVAIGCFVLFPQHWLIASIFALLAGLWYTFSEKVWEESIRKQVRKAIKKGLLQIGDLQKIELRSKGLWAQRAGSEGLVGFSNFTDAHFLENTIYLYLNDEDAIIIPRRACENPADWDSFSTSLQQSLKTH